MRAKIIKRGVSRMENGVRKGFGDIVEITRNDMKTGAYAPYRDNYVKPSTIEDVPTDDDAQDDGVEKSAGG